MLLVAGIAASVLIQTMNSLEQQALRTGTETIREISSGLKVTHVSGYSNSSHISQIALFISPLAASEDIDINSTYVSISDSSKSTVLRYNSSIYSSSISNGIFNTINSENLNSDEFGIIVIRDIDNSCVSDAPIINNQDLVVVIINVTKTFSGFTTRTDVFGSLEPEFGINGIFSFTTPSSYTNTIIDL